MSESSDEEEFDFFLRFSLNSREVWEDQMDDQHLDKDDEHVNDDVGGPPGHSVVL